MGHMIFQLPTIHKENYFTTEVIVFAISVLVLIIGILLCLWGYKYFQTLAVIILGCLSGYVGIKLTDHLTNSPIIKMFIFTIFTFLGCCLFYFLSILIDGFLKMIHLKKGIAGKMYILSSLLGAALIAFIVYRMVYDGWIICVIIFVLFAVMGMIYQKIKKASRPEFHCYEDIFKMKPLPKEENKQNA